MSVIRSRRCYESHGTGHAPHVTGRSRTWWLHPYCFAMWQIGQSLGGYVWISRPARCKLSAIVSPCRAPMWPCPCSVLHVRLGWPALALALVSACGPAKPPRSGETVPEPTPMAQTTSQMPNRLIHEQSPYLLQHAHNPVDWYPWGEEAFARAQAEEKPVFLSIGYSTCHWCHVMERESFESPDIAALLNEHFISVKVDREEHPDVDQLYMNAVMTMTGHGGWPLTVFLTPDRRPFFGGTYFPPDQRGGMTGMRQLLPAIAMAWRAKRPGGGGRGAGGG